MLLNSCVHVHVDAHASTQGQADVLLRALPKFVHHQGLLSRRALQQEQYCAARQMVQQLPVSRILVHFGYHYNLFIF